MAPARILFALVLLACLRAADAPPTVEALTQRIGALEAELLALKQQSVTFKTLAELEVSLPMWSENRKGDGALPAKLVTFLNLGEADATATTALMRTTRAAIVAEIAKQKPVAEKTPNGYRLVIADFSPDGKILEGQFLKQLSGLLGPHRLRLFQKAMAFHLREWFLDFGQSTCTYDFSGRGDAWQLKAEYKSDNGGSSSSSSPLGSLQRNPLIRPYLPAEIVEGLEGVQPKPDEKNDF